LIERSRRRSRKDDSGFAPQTYSRVGRFESLEGNCYVEAVDVRMPQQMKSRKRRRLRCKLSLKKGRKHYWGSGNDVLA